MLIGRLWLVLLLLLLLLGLLLLARLVGLVVVFAPRTGI